MRTVIRLTICFIFAEKLAVAVLAQEESNPPSPFDLPRLTAARLLVGREVNALFAQSDYAGAEQRLRALLKRMPRDVHAHYNLACALARQDKTNDALEALKKSVELGFRDRKHIEADEDLKSLRDDDRFKAIVELADVPLTEPPQQFTYQVEPAEAKNGQVEVTETDVAWNSRTGFFHAFFRIAKGDQPIAVGLGEAGDLLRKWFKEGTAAGNQGDLYDNHDSDHSNMNFKAFPQLTRIEFSEEAKKRQLHHGLQRHFVYNGVTIGNSSTAVTSGHLWRSQARLALTQPGGAGRLYLQYISNHLYFYPEHRDHDPNHGDVFPANTPYLIISQGSSGSDRDFLNAVAATLAAFRPEVKEKLRNSGLLVPTVQMIFRTSNKMVVMPEDYLTGHAHPTVFDGHLLDVVKMVTLAHEMQPESLPPLVQISVVEEDMGVVGRDYFDIQPRERLFDTPCAIARVVKSTKYERRMVVSAEKSKDLNDKPLTFHWAVLRGDAERIRINKLNDSGSVMELLVPYHERQPITPQAKLESNRVDIGVFVNNGDYYSAPAFVSFCYLGNEKRVYDDEHRIRSVDYTNPAGNYVDPLLDLQKNWRDEYDYGDDGRLLGWTRIRGESKQEFTSDGLLVLEKDDQGKPLKTSEVRYVAKPRPNNLPVLEQQPIENSVP